MARTKKTEITNDNSKLNDNVTESLVEQQPKPEIVTKPESKSATLRLSDSNIAILEKIRTKMGFKTLNDAVSELYNMYPWHVLGCEEHAKICLDRGIAVLAKDTLSDAINNEKAQFYILGINKTPLANLPQEIRDLIHVK